MNRRPGPIRAPAFISSLCSLLAARRPGVTSQRDTRHESANAVELIEAVDVSNAIAWLVSDEARYVTAVALPVDAGFTAK